MSTHNIFTSSRNKKNIMWIPHPLLSVAMMSEGTFSQVSAQVLPWKLYQTSAE